MCMQARSVPLPLIAALLAASALRPPMALATPIEIYRCPGTPAVYTSDQRLVQAGRCVRLGAAVAPHRSSSLSTSTPLRPQAAASGPASTSRTVVSRALQQQRDADRLQILQDELQRERDRHAQLAQRLTQDSTNGAMDTGTVEELRQALQRSAADVAALSRELASSRR